MFSFEVIPPQKGKNIQDLYNNIDPLMEFNPPFIDVTTSREEYVYIDKGNGLLDKTNYPYASGNGWYLCIYYA